MSHAEIRLLLYLYFLVCLVFAVHAHAGESNSRLRQNMITDIQETVRYTSAYIGKQALDEKVMAVMATVPRHEFVPERLRDYAYENRPLPIGNGQTISQPYIVALMTDLADVNKDSVVLEVGTGSGYQAAVLAELVKHVYTIEIIEKLGREAEQTLQRLGYRNVTVRIGDGYHGWLEHAPFDAILVTAAPEEVPGPLIQQLKPGGKLVIPVGNQYSSQSLQVIEKDLAGKITRHDVLPVGFVPLTGEH
ncbi:MAG: protein-L-isoaspartate(D-aspartate) O-methyltransferase [Gammaproteobacteria bacterium]